MSTEKKTERRSLVGADLRACQGDEFSLVARAVTYNALSVPGVPFSGARERIAPGAFQSSLEAGDEVLALVNHDSSQILGRTRNGSLILNDEVSCLRFRVALNPAVMAHRDLHELVKDGTLSECSFGFIVEPGGDSWTDQVDEEGASYQLRTVTRAKLLDVSIVAAPAYSDGATNAQARNLRYVNPSGSNTTADLRSRLREIDVDFRHREKLHEVGMQILADDRRAAVQPAQNPPTPDQYQNALDDFASGRYRAIGASDQFIYAVLNDDDSGDSDSEEDCYRLQFKKFLDGTIRVIGEAVRIRPDDVAPARWFSKAFESRANERLELKKRMRALAGIGSR